MQTFTDDAQPPPLVGEIPLDRDDHDDNSKNTGINPLLLSQPRTLHSRRHGGQPHASGSTTHQSRHIPPANILIPRDDASYFQDQYDATTNPYLGMQVMPMPPPWQIPSHPQVQIPPQLLGHGQLPLPVNRDQFQRDFGYNSSSVLAVQMPGHSYAMPPLSESPNYSSSSVGVQMHSHGHAMPPLSPLPPSHGGFAFDVSYPPSDVIRDNTTNMGPTPIVPSQAHIHFAPPQPYLAEFIPGFAHPVLSQDGDALLPQDVEDEYLRQHIENAPGVEDESLRDLVASTENPEDDSTFRFYRGLNDRRGRKRKVSTRIFKRSFANKMPAYDQEYASSVRR